MVEELPVKKTDVTDVETREEMGSEMRRQSCGKG